MRITKGIERSVKRYDLPAQSGGIVRLNIWGGVGPYIPQALPAELPAIGRERDRILRLTPFCEGLWASAISIAITKLASLAWDIDTIHPRVGEQMQQLLLHADGGEGWVRFLQKHLRSYYCNNQGAVVEIARETKSYGSRVAGIYHLPSGQCEPTGDPEIPILYYANDGSIHELHWWQCIRFVDMPDDNGGQYGICAAQRAYDSIIKLAAIEKYLLEKVTGNRPLEVHIVNGVSPRQLEDAFKTTQEDQLRVGHTQFMGVVMVPAIKADEGISGYRIPFAEIPDGFDYEQQFQKIALRYANAIGIDVQDIQPLTGQALGTGAQSVVLDQKARGKGSSIAWRQDFTHQLNELVLADATKFYFNERDPRDMLAIAQAQQAQVKIVTDLVSASIIDAAMGLQMIVDAEIAPKEFLDQDKTESETIGDDDKPDAESDKQGEMTPKKGDEQAEEQDPSDQEEQKPKTKAHDILSDEEQSALKLLQEVLEGE